MIDQLSDVLEIDDSAPEVLEKPEKPGKLLKRGCSESDRAYFQTMQKSRPMQQFVLQSEEQSKTSTVCQLEADYYYVFRQFKVRSLLKCSGLS